MLFKIDNFNYNWYLLPQYGAMQLYMLSVFYATKVIHAILFIEEKVTWKVFFQVGIWSLLKYNCLILTQFQDPVQVHCLCEAFS